MKTISGRLSDSLVKKLLFCMAFLIFALAITRMCFSLFKIDVNADAAYYLGVSRLIIEGKIPFLDFPPGYTPLSFYIMLLPITLFGNSFTIALIFLYLLHLLNAFLIFKIVRQFSDNKPIALYCSALCLLLCLGSDGCHYVLEPFVLTFGLLAIFVLKKGGVGRLIISGALCFCSFWSKQYGLGFICLAIAFLYLEEGLKQAFIRKSMYLLMGFFLTMAVFVSFFLIQGIDPMSMLSLSGSDYERDGIGGLIGGWKSLFISLPLLVIPIVCIIANLRGSIKNPLFIISLFGVLGFMLQCYVRFYAHYLMLVMPFAVLLQFSCSMVLKSTKWHKTYVVLFALSSMIPIYFATKSILLLANDNLRARQELCAEAIRQIVPVGSDEVYAAMDLLPIMQINSYNPPLIEKYGLSNGFVRKPEEVNDLIRAASFCIISKNELEQTQKYTSETVELLDLFFDKIQIEGINAKTVCYIFIRNQ